MKPKPSNTPEPHPMDAVMELKLALSRFRAKATQPSVWGLCELAAILERRLQRWLERMPP